MEKFSYQVIRSSRRTIAIQIAADGTVLVRCPKGMDEAAVNEFVRSRSGWIAKHLARRAAQPPMPALTDEEMKALAQKARNVIPERVTFYAAQMDVTYGRITIRSQHTRWGSCSGKGNLNFNCLLMLVPPEVLDYVVVHELCHRKQMNHSPKFWEEVGRILPEYAKSKKWLKENGNALIGRLKT